MKDNNDVIAELKNIKLLYMEGVSDNGIKALESAISMIKELDIERSARHKKDVVYTLLQGKYDAVLRKCKEHKSENGELRKENEELKARVGELGKAFKLSIKTECRLIEKYRAFNAKYIENYGDYLNGKQELKELQAKYSALLKEQDKLESENSKLKWKYIKAKEMIANHLDAKTKITDAYFEVSGKYQALLKRVEDTDGMRVAIISNLDLFREWAKRSYKNTNDLKHKNTSDIIERLATALQAWLKGEVTTGVHSNNDNIEENK